MRLSRAPILVLAVEAAEGTDRMLSRVANLRARRQIPASGGVLVKAPKPGQDRRIDLPTIGPRTIERVARAGRLARPVEILHANAPLPAASARFEIAADRGDERAEMQRPGGRGREAAPIGVGVR